MNLETKAATLIAEQRREITGKIKEAADHMAAAEGTVNGERQAARDRMIELCSESQTGATLSDVNLTTVYSVADLVEEDRIGRAAKALTDAATLARNLRATILTLEKHEGAKPPPMIEREGKFEMKKRRLD